MLETKYRDCDLQELEELNDEGLLLIGMNGIWESLKVMHDYVKGGILQNTPKDILLKDFLKTFFNEKGKDTRDVSLFIRFFEWDLLLVSWYDVKRPPSGVLVRREKTSFWCPGTT
jgi:hypothetical protein